jgi:hypothetical protein
MLHRKLEGAPPQPVVLPAPAARAAPAEVDAWIGDYTGKLQECTGGAKLGDAPADDATAAEPAAEAAADTAAAQPAKACPPCPLFPLMMLGPILLTHAWSLR